jgi:hypothetical protein
MPTEHDLDRKAGTTVQKIRARYDALDLEALGQPMGTDGGSCVWHLFCLP